MLKKCTKSQLKIYIFDFHGFYLHFYLELEIAYYIMRSAASSAGHPRNDALRFFIGQCVRNLFKEGIIYE